MTDRIFRFESLVLVSLHELLSWWLWFDVVQEQYEPVPSDVSCPVAPAWVSR